MNITQVKVLGTQTPYQVTIDDGTHQWLADEPAALGGGDTGPAPHQLLCAALGACTTITVQMYAARKQWPLEHIEVQVTLNAEGKPADGAAEFHRQIRVSGPLDESQRERLLQIANACPTHKLLAGTIRIATDLSAGTA